jgi:hypothetical protein
VEDLWEDCSSSLRALEEGADMLKQLAQLMVAGVGLEQDVLDTSGPPLIVGIGKLRHTHSEGAFYSIQD